MQLRKYQRDAVESVRTDWKQHQDVIGVAATGAGKTQIMLATLLGHEDIPPLLQDGERGLLIAHRDELIQQPLERVRSYWPEWIERTGVVKAAMDENNQQLTIASVQSLHPKRLERLLSHGNITHLLIDECHHAVADSYTRMYEALREANPELRSLGVTATPVRADKKGMIKRFSHVSFGISIKDLIRQGFLVPLRGLTVATQVDVSAVKKSQGDLAANELSSAFELDNVFDLVVATHQQHAAGRKAIAFTVSVAGAHDLAAAFCGAGIPAEALDGTTPKAERDAMLKRFACGKTMVLTNCAVLTEGFDQPDVAAVHMVRPTQNRSLFIQCVGRGLRTAPMKTDCLVLEYAPSAGHNLATLGDVLGYDKPKAQTNAEFGEVTDGLFFDGMQCIRINNGDPNALQTAQVDYLSITELHWTQKAGWMIIGLGQARDGKSRIIAIAPPVVDKPFVLYGLAKEFTSYDWEVRRLMGSEDFSAIIERANEIVEQYAASSLTSKKAKWKQDGATEGQLKMIKFFVRGQDEKPDWPTLTKGAAGDLINFYQTKQALAKVGKWYEV